MKVKIKKFAELQNIEFETPVKIEGKNKLGKTTILNAVSWCLFGKDINGDELGIRIYANEDELAEKKAEVEVF
ncbi:MAG: AAA family ATPase, partial [Bacteroidales bacterium]